MTIKIEIIGFIIPNDFMDGVTEQTECSLGSILYIFSLPLQKLRQTWIKQDIANISLNSDDDRCFVKGEQDQDTD